MQNNPVAQAMLAQSWANIDEQARETLGPWIEGQTVIGIVRDLGSTGHAIITKDLDGERFNMYYTWKLIDTWMLSADVSQGSAVDCFNALAIRFG